MQAELKGIDPDLSLYTPDDPETFMVALELLVGPKGAEGAEIFQVTLCTPKWLLASMPPEGIVLGANHLIVSDYNRKTIVYYLERYISTLDGSTWEELVRKLEKLATWEFRNYQP